MANRRTAARTALLLLLSVASALGQGGSPTESADSDPYLIELWSGTIFRAVSVVDDNSHLTLQSTDSTYYIDKLDIRSIKVLKRNRIKQFLTRDQINRSSVRALYAGYKMKLGRRSVGIYDPDRVIAVIGTNDEKRTGKVVASDAESIIIQRLLGEQKIPLTVVAQVLQGRKDVSRNFLTEAQLLQLVTKVESPTRWVMPVAEGVVGIGLLIGALYGLAYLFLYFFFGGFL